jgi:site-specific DNA-methyltransferase (adenine-specific)
MSEPVSEVKCCDNMEYMAGFPDKFFDIALLDPEYGIGRDGSLETTSRHGGRKAYEFKGWDTKPPDKKYFNEVFRISKNQIIFGANYFTKHLPASMGWIFWDKGQRICNSDGELIFTSFNRALRVVEFNRIELLKEGTIHPTQKPLVLYSWIFKNYISKNSKIIDTNLGSQNSRIAAYKLGFDFYGCELDEQYFREGCERFDRECHGIITTKQGAKIVQQAIWG